MSMRKSFYARKTHFISFLIIFVTVVHHSRAQFSGAVEILVDMLSTLMNCNIFFGTLLRNFHGELWQKANKIN